MASLANRIGTSMTQTRQSYGSQIREALDDMTAKDAIYADGVETTSDGRQLHKIILTAGQLADIFNALGYDIRFGKNPRMPRCR